MSRGPHASDPSLFGSGQLDALREAVADVEWLLGRGYAEPSTLKLVGDRYRLRARQREAVRRGACAPAVRSDRVRRRLQLSRVVGRDLAIDGFNVVIVTETLLGGGVVLRGSDGALRDLASVHGNYRRIEVTERALDELRAVLVAARPRTVRWALDRPVSNSGRLRDLILARAPDASWEVELFDDADRAVLEQARAQGAVVASADGNVLDHAADWIDLPDGVRDAGVSGWVVELGAPV